MANRIGFAPSLTMIFLKSRRESPSPPFRGEREGPSAKRWEGEVVADGRSGIPHLTPTLSAPQWPKGGGEGATYPCGRWRFTASGLVESTPM